MKLEKHYEQLDIKFIELTQDAIMTSGDKNNFTTEHIYDLDNLF